MKLQLNHGRLQEAMSESRDKAAYLHIGFILRRLRELSGTSQGELARHDTANLSYISSVECGRNNISIRKIQLICNALQLTPARLIAIQNKIEQAASLADQTGE
jgi:transcriptional regulator with XRE-family HTH domain